MTDTVNKLELKEGLIYYPGLLDQDHQNSLLSTIREVVKDAPLFVPQMPRTGKPMSVRMSNCGKLGWVTDKENGYRYQPLHPSTGNQWPKIPEALIDLWQRLSGYPDDPEACLINFYDPDARMGLHQDRDEQNFEAPVLSVSLGDDCLFRYGGENRSDGTKSIRLKSGDVILLSGKARLIFHGVDRIYKNTSDLLKSGGRINLTLRRVSK